MTVMEHSVPDGYADRPGPEKQPVTPDAATESTTDNTADTRRVPFGRPMRALFEFAPTFRPLNHGSFGTFPAAVRRVREHHLHLYEARPDLYRYFEQPRLYNASRAALQPLFGPGVHPDELALVANATTGVNVVLTNLVAQWSTEEEEAVRHGGGDDDATKNAVLYFATTYESCRKTLLALAAHNPRLVPVPVPVAYPRDDDATVVARLRAVHADTVARGLRPRLVLLDTVVSGPGVRMPWPALVAAARDLGLLSLIDGAHGIGHVDLTRLGDPAVQPDFFVSNCHKWLFVPRGCAVLYVPFRNQHLIETSVPTSHGYAPPADRPPLATSPTSPAPSTTYFTNLFQDVGTMDYSPWACIPAALAFRRDVCGGEEAIRAYCFGLAREGGDRAAAILGTEVLDNPRSALRECCLVNVRLPLAIEPEGGSGDEDGAAAASTTATTTTTTTSVLPRAELQAAFDWMRLRAAEESDTYFQILLYQGAFWVRFSAQVYLELADFEWGARVLLDLCKRVQQGEYKAAKKD